MALFGAAYKAASEQNEALVLPNASLPSSLSEQLLWTPLARNIPGRRIRKGQQQVGPAVAKLRA
jgi:hypothetical protein